MEGKHGTAAASLSSPSRRTHNGRPTRFRLLERMCKQRLHNHGVWCRSKGRSEQNALAAVGELEVDVLEILPLNPPSNPLLRHGARTLNKLPSRLPANWRSMSSYFSTARWMPIWSEPAHGCTRAHRDWGVPRQATTAAVQKRYGASSTAIPSPQQCGKVVSLRRLQPGPAAVFWSGTTAHSSVRWQMPALSRWPCTQKRAGFCPPAATESLRHLFDGSHRPGGRCQR